MDALLLQIEEEREAALAESAEDQADETEETTTASEDTSTSQDSTDNDETLSQQNAVNMAKNYLAFMPFSKSGLVDQLEFEGFSNDDATYAVNNIDVDWNEQAVLSAQNYLDFMSFSRSGLIEQLKFEGFST